MKNNFTQIFNNFILYSRIDLFKLNEAIFEKVGYAFVDFKGNFSKIIFNSILKYMQIKQLRNFYLNSKLEV
jgi:hypothetical protein